MKNLKQILNEYSFSRSTYCRIPSVLYCLTIKIMSTKILLKKSRSALS